MNETVKHTEVVTQVMTDLYPEHKLQVMNSQYETLYLSINKLAAAIINTPIAMITFNNEQHVWVEANACCSEIEHTHRELFYQWAIGHHQYTEIQDMSLTSSQQTHTLNTYYPAVKYYAGVPIVLPMGEVIGVLSVFDTKPSCMDHHQQKLLLALADVISKSMVFKHHFIRS